MLLFVIKKEVVNLSMIPAAMKLYSTMSESVDGKTKWAIVSAGMFALARLPREDRERLVAEVMAVEFRGDAADAAIADAYAALLTERRADTELKIGHETPKRRAAKTDSKSGGKKST
jgi:hypothetical protein